MMIFLALVLALVNGNGIDRYMEEKNANYCGAIARKCTQDVGMENYKLCSDTRGPCMDNPPPFEILCAACFHASNPDECHNSLQIKKTECFKKSCFINYYHAVQMDRAMGPGYRTDPATFYDCVNGNKKFCLTSGKVGYCTDQPVIPDIPEAIPGTTAPKCTRCACSTWSKPNKMYSNCKQYTGTCKGVYCVKCEADGTTPMPGNAYKHTAECAKYEGSDEASLMDLLEALLNTRH